MKYFEDYKTGEQFKLGQHTFEKDAIIAFAEKFDPQYFHLEEDAAKDSLFGGLVASGWHTASVFMKLFVAYHTELAEKQKQAGIPIGELGPSTGFTDMKWLQPVYAGDTISYTSRIQEKIVSQSRPEWGLLKLVNEGKNQNSQSVFAFTGTLFCKRR